MLRKIKRIVATKLSEQLSMNTTSLVANINLDLTKKQQRVLISYISTAFFVNVDKIKAKSSNVAESLQIVRFFISRDFVIDLVDLNDMAALPKIEHVKYDFIFGQGKIFFYMIKKYPDVNNCIYVTENHPDFSIEKEKERIKYFYERHRIKWRYSRSNLFFKNEHFDFAKNAIVMGIESQFRKYNYKKCLLINPTGKKNEDFLEHTPITNEKKRNFLWFGSIGAVHKGLDILIDVVERNSDFDLHICGLAESKKRFFRRAISKIKNVHNHGFVNVNSQEFVDIINLCAFMVFPSCSEAMSTSVLTVARHGVLPLIIKGAGLDRLGGGGDYAFYLDDFHVEYVEKRMREISSLDNDFLTRKSRELQKYADKEFCLQKFTENFENCMQGVLE